MLSAATLLLAIWGLVGFWTIRREWARVRKDRLMVRDLSGKVKQQVLRVPASFRTSVDEPMGILACHQDGTPCWIDATTFEVLEGPDLSDIRIAITRHEDGTVTAVDQHNEPVRVLSNEEVEANVLDGTVSHAASSVHQDAVEAQSIDRGEDQHRAWVRQRIGDLLASSQIRGSRLASWIDVLEEAWCVGGQVNSSAFLDTVWNQERESLRWVRFFSRNAVLLGLIITSFSLALTLRDLAPVFDQVTSQSFEEASKSIQSALGRALVPMGTAFFASFMGLALTLLLGGVADWLAKVQDEYLEDLDRFLQSIVIPHFSARVEDDRKDAMGFILSRIDSILEQMSTQHSQVVKELADLGPSLTESAKIMKNQLSNFSKSLKVLENLAADASTVGGEIRKTMEDGQRTLQASHDRFADGLETWLHETVEPQLEAVRQQSETWGQFRAEAAVGLGAAGRNMDEILAVSKAAQASVAELVQALEGARHQWESSSVTIAELPDNFGKKMLESGSRVVSDSMAKQDQLIRDLNRQVGERFSDLVRALGAALGG